MATKTVLITGCSEGGIGDALAKEFHKKGLRVFATARNLAKVQHLKEMGLDVVQLDVKDDMSIKQAVERVKNITGGRLDFLVNNSGAGYHLPMMDTTVEGARKVFEVNIFAVVAVTQAYAPLLIASQGTVINVTSIAAYVTGPWQGYYGASKAAVASITDTLRVEMAPFGVKFINAVTGVVKTRFFENNPDHHLPSSSLYLPAKEPIENWMNGVGVREGGMEADIYAAAVVTNALKGKPKEKFWAGGLVWVVWFMTSFFLTSIQVSIQDYFICGISKIRKQIRDAEKSAAVSSSDTPFYETSRVS